MLTMTCHACQETITEDALVELGVQHTQSHGHAPDELVLARIRHANRHGLTMTDNSHGVGVVRSLPVAMPHAV